MSAYTPTVTGTGPRAAVQRFGAFLAGMIMPNLGAFIAWGLITALTIQNGWMNLIARATGAIPNTATSSRRSRPRSASSSARSSSSCSRS